VRFDTTVFGSSVGPTVTAGGPVLSSGMVYFYIKSATDVNTCGFTYSDASTTGTSAFVGDATLSGC